MWIFTETPLIETGKPAVNGMLTIIFCCAVSLAALQVMAVFSKAFAHQKLNHKDGKPPNVRKREITVLFLLALISFVVVLRLRFEHHSLKLVTMREIHQWYDGLAEAAGGNQGGISASIASGAAAMTDAAKSAPKNYESLTSSIGSLSSGIDHAIPHNMHELHQVADSMTGAVKAKASKAYHAAGEAAGKAMHVNAHQVTSAANEGAQQVKEGAQKGVNNFRKIPGQAKRKAESAAQEVVEKAKEGVDAMALAAQGGKQYVSDTITDFLFKGKGLPRAVASRFPWVSGTIGEHLSVWDFFKTLIDTAPRLFWTQQWLAGYVTWAIFVGIECRQRRFQFGLAWSFVLLGWTFSLAGAQSLFYALMLMKPEPQPRKSRRVPNQLLLPIPFIIEMGILSWFSWQSHRQPRDPQASILNILQGILMVIPPITAFCIQDISGSKRFLRGLDFAYKPRFLKMIWCGIALGSLILQWRTIYTVWASGSNSWLTIGLHYFDPKANQQGDIVRSAWSMFSALGDHPWVNAVGWDVILAGVGLMIWAAASSADVESMIKCSVWPFLDGTIELVQEGADAAKPYVEATKEKAGDLYDAAAPYVDTAKEKAEDLYEGAQPGLEYIRDKVGDATDQAGGFLSRNGYGAEDIRESARYGVTSGLNTLYSVSRQTGRRISEAAQTAMKGVIEDFGSDDDDEEEDESDGEEHSHSNNSRTKTTALSDADKDNTHRRPKRQSRRDTDRDENDWEESPRRKSKSPVKRGRGRPPSKTRSALSQEHDLDLHPKKQRQASESPVKQRRCGGVIRAASERVPSPVKQRRSTRIRNLTTSAADNLDALGRNSKPRKPQYTFSALREAMDDMPQVPRELAEGGPAAGLAFGLCCIGGLGFASAGVFGADELQD